MDAATFGSRIREARERLGISQEELAERLNKKQRAISEYENGNRRMFVTDMPELAKALGVPISFFFEGEMDNDDRDEIILAEFRRLNTPEARQTVIGIVRQFCDFVTSNRA